MYAYNWLFGVNLIQDGCYGQLSLENSKSVVILLT